MGASRGVGGYSYRGNFENALTHLREKRSGNAFASYLVGQIYANGRVGAPNSELALEWYLKAADQGSIAAPFSYLNHQLVSMNRSLGFCADFREVVLLSERVKSIYAYLFLSQYHANGVCDAPNVLKSAYYTHLASSLDRAFGPNRDNLYGQLSELQRQRLEKLLQQTLSQYLSANFSISLLKQFFGKLAAMSFCCHLSRLSSDRHLR